jgi:hypothetical protein
MRPSLQRRTEADEPPVEGMWRGVVVNKEWHVEYRPNPLSRGSTEFIWRLRDEQGWFLMCTKQKDAWSTARRCARIYGGRAFLHRKDGSVRAVSGRSDAEPEK